MQCHVTLETWFCCKMCFALCNDENFSENYHSEQPLCPVKVLKFCLDLTKQTIAGKAE